MKVSPIALILLTGCQYSCAFVPGHSRKFAKSVLLSTKDSQEVKTFVDDPVIYEDAPKNELDLLAKSGLFEHNKLIPGSDFEDIPTRGKPLTKVVGTVRAPIENVWKLARGFGGTDVTTWWKIYKNDEVSLDGPDAVGVERTFAVNGRVTSELLADRSDKNHRFVYKLTQGKGYPTGYYGTTTVVSMKPKGPNQTEVTWESWSHVHPLIVETIEKGQARAYKGAIASLDKYFNPAIGNLDVDVVSASGVSGRLYAVVKIKGSDPQETHVIKGDNPVYNQSFNFDVLDPEAKVSIALLDAKWRKDDVLGTATFKVKHLEPNKPTEVSLPLEGSCGGSVKVSFGFKPDKYKLEIRDELSGDGGGFDIESMKNVVQDIANKAFDAVVVYNMGKQKTIEYDRYSRSPQLDNVPLENLPRAAKGLPFNEQLKPDKLGLVFQRVTEYLYSQADIAVNLKKQENLPFGSGDRFKAFYGQYLQPTANTKNIVKHSGKDHEQARQYLNGMSPMMISQVQSLSEIPDIPLKNVKLGGEDLQSIIDRKGLFFVDYRHLDGLKLYENMIFYAPYALMYKPKGLEELTMGAIQLERTPDADVYTSNRHDTHESRWKYARLQLACADNQYHQFIYHLGFAHLAMEPHIVSVHNSFPEHHIVKKLLTPHFKDTIGINFLARQTLVSEVKPITDRTFSPGTAQAMELFLKAWEEYDFFEDNFENNLKNRGFTEDMSDGVKDYYYREDGFKVWNAIGNYVTKVVDAEYVTDEDVEKDKHIQAWALETSSPGKADIPGFPTRIYSKALLVKVIQTIIWNLSAAHSAVNFSQYDYLSYIPNRPNALFEKMPEGSPKDPIPDYEKTFLRKALPNDTISHFEILFSWLLTTPPQVTLDKVDAMKDTVPEAHESFHAEMNAIHNEIKSRNDALAAANKPNYPYLDPARIEASIAI